MRLENVLTESDARAWWREQWRDTSFVEEMLAEYRWKVCAGLVNGRISAGDCQWRLFVAELPLWAQIFSSVSDGACGPSEVLESVLGDNIKKNEYATEGEIALEIYRMSLYPATDWAYKSALRQLQRIVTWRGKRQLLMRRGGEMGEKNAQ